MEQEDFLEKNAVYGFGKDRNWPTWQQVPDDITWTVSEEEMRQEKIFSYVSSVLATGFFIVFLFAIHKLRGVSKGFDKTMKLLIALVIIAYALRMSYNVLVISQNTGICSPSIKECT